MQTQKIQSFTDLTVWQRGHEYVLLVYKITRLFPKEELFGLASQIRRATVSITSNIAEGFGRSSIKEKVHFYSYAYGSLLEVQNQVLIAKDLKYLQKDDYDKLVMLSIEIGKMLQGLIKKIKADSPAIC